MDKSSLLHLFTRSSSWPMWLTNEHRTIVWQRMQPFESVVCVSSGKKAPSVYTVCINTRLKGERKKNPNEDTWLWLKLFTTRKYSRDFLYLHGYKFTAQRCVKRYVCLRWKKTYLSVVYTKMNVNQTVNKADTPRESERERAIHALFYTSSA